MNNTNFGSITPSFGGVPITPQVKPLGLPAIRGVPGSSLTPVQLNMTAINALATTNLVNSSENGNLARETSIASVNDKFKWTTAQISSLFKAIANDGIVTAQDAARIDELRKDLKEIESQLEETDKAAAAGQIRETYNELQRIDTLRQQLPAYRRTEQQLQETFLDVTSHEVGPLCSFDAASRSLDLFAELSSGIDDAHPLHPFLMETSQWLTEFMEHWTYNLANNTLAELDRLERVLTDDPHNQAAQQLLASIEDSLWIAKGRLNTLIDKANRHGLQDIEKILREISRKLGKIYDERPQLISEAPRPPPVAYGSAAWQTLMEACPQPKSNAIERLLNPKEWSESTKDVVFRLMAAAQLLQQGVSFYEQITNSEGRKRLADDLQRQVIRDVPQEMQERIGKEGSMLERLLVEKFDSLSNPSVLHALTKKHPEILPALQSALEHYGQQQPSEKDIQSIGKAYRLQRLVQASPAADPTHHMSFNEWWTFFTAHEKPEPPDIKRLTAEPLPLATAAAATTEVSLGALQRFGNWLNIFNSSTTAPSYQSFVNDTCAAKRAEVIQTVEKARAIEDQLVTIPAMPSLEPLRELVSLSLGALMTNVRKMSCSDLSLTELADLLQAVDDQCFAIEELEKLMDKEMDKVRETLRGDVTALEAGGKKHTNIVLMHRYVEALGIPGITIPVPVAIDSDRIHALLKAQAPEVYAHWEALDALHSTFQGPEMFLESENAKHHLQAIDAAIANAFAAEDAFEAMNPSQELITFLDNVAASGDYLMVRSTGSEDSRELANAGGNVSRAYVSPERKEFCKAVGDVVRSYFGAGSLQNRLNASQFPFKEELKLAVTTQQLVGEPVGGATDPKDIPTSMVLFSNEPLYIGGEPWRLMRISASYGHGEGVVGNLGIASDTYLLMASEAEPDKLYILRDVKDKPERLAPVRDADGKVALAKVPNPPEMRYRAALSDEELVRLYHYGVVGEQFFEDMGTDMEIVNKRGIIYPVQARPVNRPEMLPTYVDMHKIAAATNSPVTQTLHTDLLVVGKASVVQITKAEEILVAPTLEEAERRYNKDLHKLVIVNQDEPVNSHPVVNFSNLGMPCLVAKDAGAVNAITAKVDATHPLAVCVQTGSIHLWDTGKGDINEFVSKGFGVHPAKIAISMPTPISGPSTSPSREIPDEVKSLLIAIRDATTQEAARSALTALQNTPWVADVRKRTAFAAAKLSSDETMPAPIRERFTALASFGKKLNKAIAETEATIGNLREGSRLKPLFRAKVIESLLVGRKDKADSLGQFSAIDIVGIDQDIDQLLAYQKGLTHPAHLMDLVLIGNKAITPESSKQWADLLMRLEPLIEDGTISQEKVAQFKAFLSTLQQADVMTPWLTFYLPKVLGEAKNAPIGVNTLECLINTLPNSENDFVALQLQTQRELQGFKNQLNRFGDPKSFPEAWKTLQTFASIDLQKRLTGQLNNHSPVAQMIALSTMKQLVDLYDAALKSTLSPNKWSEEEKVRAFKEMLYPFRGLLRVWLRDAVRKDSIPMYPTWSFTKYLELLKDCLDHSNYPAAEQLLPGIIAYSGEQFSVIPATLGSGTDYLLSNRPKTLVDIFTTVHQSLLEAIGSVNNDLFSAELLQTSGLPDSFQEGMKLIASTFPNRVALDVKENHVTAKFNVLLRQHSSTLTLTYDTQTRSLTLGLQFIGINELDRWDYVQLIAEGLSKADILPLASPTKAESETLSLSWKISSQDQLAWALDQFNEMGRASMTGYKDYFLKLEKSLAPSQFAKFSTNIMLMAASGEPSNTHLRSFYDIVLEMYTHRLNAHPSVVEAAEEAVTSQNTIARTVSLRMVSQLIEKQPLPADLIQRIGEVIQKGSVDSDPEIRANTYRFFFSQQTPNQFLKKAEHHGKALAMLYAGMEDPNPMVRAEAFKCYHVLPTLGSPLEKMRVLAYTGVNDPNPKVRAEAFNWFSILLQQGAPDTEMIAAIKKLTQDSDPWVKRRAESSRIGLYKEIVYRGHIDAVEPAMQVAVAAAISSDLDVKLSGIGMFKALIHQGHTVAFEPATQAATAALRDGNSSVRQLGLELFKALIDQNHIGAFEPTTQAAVAAMQHDDSSVRQLGLELFKALINEGHSGAFEPATQAAVAAIQDNHLFVKYEGWELMNLLTNQDSAKPVIQISIAAIQDSDLSKQHFGWALLDILISRGYTEAFELVTQAAVAAVQNDDRSLKLSGFELFSNLVKRGRTETTKPATKAAIAAIQDSNTDIVLMGLELLQTLVRDAKAFDEAAQAVSKTILSSDPSVKNAAAILFGDLISQVGMYDSAAKIAVELWSKFKFTLFG